MVKISVIVPIYNVEKYVDDCLQSLIHQTLSDIEIICVDDCGSDLSMEKTTHYAMADERIKIIHNKKNCGLSVSRNVGLKVASAPYVMFCDADDWYESDMCEKLYLAIDTAQADMGICGTDVVYENHKDVVQKWDKAYFYFPYRGVVTLDKADFRKLSVCVWNKIFRREIIADKKIDFPIGLKFEDEFFYAAYTCWCVKAVFVSEKLYHYRRRCGSIIDIIQNEYAEQGVDLVKNMVEYQVYLEKMDLWEKYYTDFWTEDFMSHVVNALIMAKGKNDKIFEVAGNLIETKYTQPVCNHQLKRALRNILKGKFVLKRRKFFGGIIGYQNNYHKFVLSFCRAEIFRIKYAENRCTYYFFGLPLWKKEWV